eukprot:gene3667-13740_t
MDPKNGLKPTPKPFDLGDANSASLMLEAGVEKADSVVIDLMPDLTPDEADAQVLSTVLQLQGVLASSKVDRSKRLTVICVLSTVLQLLGLLASSKVLSTVLQLQGLLAGSKVLSTVLQLLGLLASSKLLSTVFKQQSLLASSKVLSTVLQLQGLLASSKVLSTVLQLQGLLASSKVLSTVLQLQGLLASSKVDRSKRLTVICCINSPEVREVLEHVEGEQGAAGVGRFLHVDCIEHDKLLGGMLTQVGAGGTVRGISRAVAFGDSGLRRHEGQQSRSQPPAKYSHLSFCGRAMGEADAEADALGRVAH